MGKIRSIGDHLNGLVPSASESTIQSICDDREIRYDEPIELVTKRMRDLCYADLLKVVVKSASNTTGSKNSDGGWKSEECGFTYSESDKNRMWETANSIYKMYDDERCEQSRLTKIFDL